MAGILKEKKKLFNKTEPAVDLGPKEVIIAEAEGGFTVRCHGGSGEYGRKPKVATSLAAAMRFAKEHFGAEASSDKDE